MKSFAAFVIVLALSPSAFAKTHSYIYPMSCADLWPAVKDTLRNSGKYGIIGIDKDEMTASYNIGGTLGGKRINSLVLNKKDNGCELQVQTAFSGFTTDDAGDLKKRVDSSLAKMGPAQSAKPVTTPAPATAPPAL